MSAQSLPERMLWASVLESAVRDALRNKPTDEPGSKRNSVQWRQDRAYIRTSAFSEICLLAGVDPQYASDRILNKMASIEG